MQDELLNYQTTPTMETTASKSTIDDILALVGDTGKYQQFLMFIGCFACFTAGICFILFPFLFYHPKFLCLDMNGLKTECSEAAACLNQYKYEVVFEKESFVTTYQLYCENAYLEEYAKSFYFIMQAIGVWCFSALSDLYGRKRILLIGSYFLTFGSFLLFFAEGFKTKWFGHSINNVICSMLFTVSSAYFVETMGKLNR